MSRAHDELGLAAIYCRVAPLRDPDQTPVDRQEEVCQGIVADLGAVAPGRLVFLDNARAAWLPGRRRPGWEAMLAAARAGLFARLVVYRPERLLRHPDDLLELFAAVRSHRIELAGHTEGWDLADRAALGALRERAERAVREALLVSEKARAAHAQAAEAGRAHGGGRRPYGYARGMGELIEAEARVVREIYARYLGGEPQRALARELNERGVPTALGELWAPGKVTRILDAPRYAGIRVFRGQIVLLPDGSYQMGAWPACVNLDQWERVRQLRAKAARDAANRRPDQRYLLTGLVECTGCGNSMVGSIVNGYRMYACTTHYRVDAAGCERHVSADRLEQLAQEHAISVLERLDSGAAIGGALALRARALGAAPQDSLVSAPHHAVRIRSATALDGVATGVGARFAWNSLPFERKAAALDYLLASVRVDPATRRGTFDEGRVEIRHCPIGVESRTA
jgi:site-specific DNA recombinase